MSKTLSGSLFSILIILITRISLCAAIWCYGEMPAPKAQHCTHVLAHLPDFNNHLLADIHTNNSASVDPSSPFTPNARFSHRSCFIGIQLRDQTTETLLPGDLTQPSTTDAWKLVHDTAVDIIRQCVERDQMGSAVGILDVTTRPYYRVRVSRPVEGLVRWQMYQRHGFERLNTRPRPSSLDNQVWTPLYIID